MTPFTIYRKIKDGVITAIVGKPANPLLILADMIREEPAAEIAPETTNKNPASTDKPAETVKKKEAEKGSK